ncbi:MAG: glutathione peroxidase [Chromatiales bacterium]|nr:glutathione peroxidase [Chromatiales bacterium]
MSLRTALLLPLSALGLAGTALAGEDCPALLDHELPRLHSDETVRLCEFAGRPVLMVNTASYCGFTGQFRGLEALWQEKQDAGLVVIGFPSDDFNQEDADEAVTAEVCFINYGVTFTMLAHSSVARGELNPVFAELERQGAMLPRWNFHKYVIDRSGQVHAEFGSRTTPEDPELRAAILAVIVNGTDATPGR